MRRVWLVALLALAFASPVSAACVVNLKAFPVTMAGSSPMISGKINGHPVRFLADSGAVFSLLSPAVATEFKLLHSSIDGDIVLSGVGGAVVADFATVKKLDIAGLVIPNVKFMVGGSDVGHDAAGVLGQNFWHLADDDYDLANGLIRLAAPSGCGDQSLAYWAKTTPVSVIDLWRNPHPNMHGTVGYATVNGVRILVVFDTGAGSSFLTFAAARRARIDPFGPGTSAGEPARGLGRGGVRTRIASVDRFQIGDEIIEHTKLRLGDTDLPEGDMLLGADFFLSHHVYVANSQNKIYFTYNGGPVFALAAEGGDGETPAPPRAVAMAATGSPTASGNAVDLGRRGAAELGRLEYDLAIADLGRAHDLAPREPLYLYQRALAYAATQQTALALADLDAAIPLAAGDAEPLISRARLRVGADMRVPAIADLDAASRLLPPESDARFALGKLYSDADDFSAAKAQFDLWIKNHPDDSKLAAAYGHLCWGGALGGADLTAAIRICDTALRMVPGDSELLAGRSLARLRFGALIEGFSDARAAVRHDPKNAWALYDKGLAEEKLGNTVEGQADIAAASAIDAKLLPRALRLGIPMAVWSKTPRKLPPTPSTSNAVPLS